MRDQAPAIVALLAAVFLGNTRRMETTIELRKLGNSDLAITPIGFGAWAVGGGDWRFGWGDQDDAESIAAIRRAVELGINWIDTAAVYGFGHSEETVRKALDGMSHRPYVFTKCGLVPSAADSRVPTENISAASIKRECDSSLKRLGMEAIDLYQIHWPTDNIEDIDEAWSTMAELQRAGKVRYIGVSNFNVAELERALAIAPITSLQPPYSLVKPEVEDEILPFCKQHGIGTIVYSPMGAGLLTGAMTRERAQALPANDWRANNPEFQEPRLTHNLELAALLAKIGARHGHSAGEVAIAWTLHNPAVTAAIVGARSARQVDGNAGALSFRLSEEECAEIEAFRGDGRS
jgi:aryl-alcohol dehydrogenase-like predicted oxidoreductase